MAPKRISHFLEVEVSQARQTVLAEEPARVDTRNGP
jgi:hypothetical protein